MKIFFPQWQGSGSGTAIQSGASAIRDYLGAQQFHELPLSEIPAGRDGKQRFAINNYDALTEQLLGFKTFLEETQPKSLEILGGDCGLEIVPVSYLNKIYPKLGIIWFDAHGDINTASDSPSGNFHGMPLRTLLGEGVPAMDPLLFSTIQSAQIHYVGLRDLDEAEQLRLRRGNIYHSGKTNTPELIHTLKTKNIQYLYIHFDFDCLDPTAYNKTYYQVPNGIKIAEAESCIKALHEEFDVVGTSSLESVTEDITALQPIHRLLELQLA